MIAIAATMAWSLIRVRYPKTAAPGQSVVIPADPFRLDDALMIGDPSAKIALVEFSDFECPYCGRFARDVWPRLETKYIDSGKVQLGFYNLPLSIHEHVKAAAAAAECASRQNKFALMHMTLFQHQDDLGPDSLDAKARSIGLDMNDYHDCLTGAGEAVQRQASLAKRLNVSVTPTFIVGVSIGSGLFKGTGAITGARAFDDFMKAIESSLAVSGAH